jgi:hypothetical protein
MEGTGSGFERVSWAGGRIESFSLPGNGIGNISLARNS